MLILAIVFLVLTLLAVSTQKTYHHLPVKELKRRARHGDKLAKSLFRPAAYGLNLRLMLWTITILSAAASYVLFAQLLSPWLAFLLVIVLLWFEFLWLPSTRVTAFGNHLAIWLAPILAWLLRIAHPILEYVSRFARNHSPLNMHTGIYDKEDLLDLLEWQKEQPDNRIMADELTISENALTFGDKRVHDVLVPQRAVVVINSNDTVTPILIDELHKTGHSRFPVYESKKSNIVGTLYLRDLIAGAKQSGKVSTIMKRQVYYVHEDFSLHQVLQAFLKTKHHLFIVVNSFEEFVGIITIEDVLAQVIGKPLIDEFDQYDDLRTVAETSAKKDHKERKEADIELTSDLVSEDVVE